MRISKTQAAIDALTARELAQPVGLLARLAGYAEIVARVEALMEKWRSEPSRGVALDRAREIADALRGKPEEAQP